jgi:hypothetical protein
MTTQTLRSPTTTSRRYDERSPESGPANVGAYIGDVVARTVSSVNAVICAEEGRLL